MNRLVEVFVALSAISGIATFLGFRAAARRVVRGLGRPAKPTPEMEEERRLHEHDPERRD